MDDDEHDWKCECGGVLEMRHEFTRKHQRGEVPTTFTCAKCGGRKFVTWKMVSAVLENGAVIKQVK